MRRAITVTLRLTLAASVGALAGCGSSAPPGHAGSGRVAGEGHRRSLSASAAPRHVRGPHAAAVPILMYHVISAAPAGTPYPQLWVPGPTFAAEMQALAGAGFHGVTLGQVFDYWDRGLALPPRPIVVSFDDGYASQSEKAAPALEALQWPGVLNLEVDNLHVAGGLRPAQVRKLMAAGWEIDAHTITHPDLTTVGPARLRTEIAGSRAAIRREFGVPVDFFCYPSGRFDAAAEAAVRAAGYRGATTTQPGLARPAAPFTLKRVRVNASETPESLLATLRSLGAA